MRTLALLTAACALAPGCRGDDATGGAGAGARYRLARVGSDPLPVVVGARDGCAVLLTGGAVTFPGDGSYRSEFALESRCPGRGAEPLRDPGTAGAVRFQADTAIFSDSLGDPAGRGVLAAESLVVGGTQRLVYLRERRRE